jgi:hypothetical protein
VVSPELKKYVVIAFSWDTKQFVPNCLRVPEGSVIKFINLTPDNPLVAMTTQGSQPNPLSEGSPHGGEFTLEEISGPEGAATAYGFYSGMFGSEGPPGSTGASGALYVTSGLP